MSLVLAAHFHRQPKKMSLAALTHLLQCRHCVKRPGIWTVLSHNSQCVKEWSDLPDGATPMAYARSEKGLLNLMLLDFC